MKKGMIINEEAEMGYVDESKCELRFQFKINKS